MITVYLRSSFLPALTGGSLPDNFICPLAVRKGKEAYTPLTEQASLLRSVGKKMTVSREISGKNLFGFIKRHYYSPECVTSLLLHYNIFFLINQVYFFINFVKKILN